MTEQVDTASTSQDVATTESQSLQGLMSDSGSTTNTETTTQPNQNLILGKFKDTDALAKSYKELEGKLGETSKNYKDLEAKHNTTIKVPGEDATEEERAAFYKALGKPDSVDGYTFSEEAQALLEPANASILDTMKQAAFESNIAAKDFEKLATNYVKAERAAYDAMYEQAQAQLQAEWGNNYEANAKAAGSALREILGAEQAQAVIARYGADADFARVMFGISSRISEDKVGTGTTANMASAESALAERNNIQNNKSHQLYSAYWDKNDPNHKFAVSEVSRLNNLIG